MSNAWIQHVKAYQNKHNCSYKEALKGAKLTYNKVKKGGNSMYSQYEDDWEEDKAMRLKPYNPYNSYDTNAKLPAQPSDNRFGVSYEIPSEAEPKTNLNKAKDTFNKLKSDVSKFVTPKKNVIIPNASLRRQLKKLLKK